MGKMPPAKPPKLSALQRACLCRLRLGEELPYDRFVPLAKNAGAVLFSLKDRGLAVNHGRYWLLTFEGRDLRRQLGLEEI